MNNNIKIAIFTGSFRPFTRGHADIVERGLKIFDKIIIAVGVNAAKAPDADASADFDAITALYAHNSRVEVERYCCLTADYAVQKGACAILKGVRSIKDYEYERDMADINRQLSGIETVILFSSPELSAISSSVVRELRSYGRNVGDFLP